MTTRRPRVVLMVGEPGSGKTELGLALSHALGIPFVARDQMRRGMFVTAGAWADRPHAVPSADDAVEAFLAVVETMASAGVSCVAEYVVRTARPEDLDRLVAAAECVVVRTSCRDAPARRARRDSDDALLVRPEVLAALGHRDAAAAEEARAERMRQVSEEMMATFPVPVLDVVTDDGWVPPLDQIVEFAIRAEN